MKNFIQSGNVVTLAAPVGGVKSGDGVAVGAFFGIAATDADAGDDVEVALTGVYELPKDNAAIDAGAKVYWVTANKNCSATAAGGILIGAATEAAGSGDAKVRVRLNGIAIV